MAALVSAAQRRKQRRLRSWWRHEQQSVDRCGAGYSVPPFANVGTLRTPPYGDRRLAPAQRWALPTTTNSFRTMAGPPGGSGQRHCLSRGRRGRLSGTAGIEYELAQNLDVPVLHMVEQLPDVLQFFVTCLSVAAEQVIDVPKISLDRTQQRLGDCLRQPQTADQLVEAPTTISFSSLQRIVEQIQLSFRFLVVEVFKVSSQVRVQRLRPLLRTFVLVLWMSRFNLFFALCPKSKKCGVGSALGVGTGCGL